MTQTAETSPREASSREAWPAMLTGWRGRCPSCSKGRMFRAWLKVADHCPACNEALHHHRADDAPAYFVIVIVGHIVVPLAMSVEMAFAPSYWWHAAMWLPLTLVLSLSLLQPIKGTLVGLQWALRMHGFNPAEADHDELAPSRVTEARR